jgi:hypothetical protein
MQEPRATQELRELPVDLIEPGPSQPRLLDVIEELNAEDVVVVNLLSEMVKSLSGFELSQ